MKVHAHFLQKNGDDPTDAWLQYRLGKITASAFDRFVKLDGTLRKGEMPETYLCEKLFERWTGREMANKFFSLPSNNGIIVEHKAALFAEMEYGLKIQPVGFVSDDAERFGCSPDGLIGWIMLSDTAPSNFGINPGKGKLGPGISGIEIKAPALATHIKYLLAGELPDDYFCQVQGSMFVTGCQTWHFLSYPLACYLDGFPTLHLIVERDEKFCANLAESLGAFIERYDEAFTVLCEKNGGPPKPPAPTPDQLRSAEPSEDPASPNYRPSPMAD